MCVRVCLYVCYSGSGAWLSLSACLTHLWTKALLNFEPSTWNIELTKSCLCVCFECATAQTVLMYIQECTSWEVFCRPRGPCNRKELPVLRLASLSLAGPAECYTCVRCALTRLFLRIPPPSSSLNSQYTTGTQGAVRLPRDIAHVVSLSISPLSFSHVAYRAERVKEEKKPRY